MKQFLIIIILVIALFWASKGFALTISPPLQEYRADPGQELSGVIKLINDEDVVRVYYASVERFKAKGEKGEAEYTGPTADETQLASWIKLEQTSVILQPRERKEIRYKISVPEKASAGGNYAAIFWSSQAPEIKGAAGIGVVGKIGSLFLVRISGEIVEDGKVAEFKTDKNFYNRKPINFSLKFENLGNVHLKPAGEITLKPKFLGIGRGRVPINPQQGNVLPRSKREFEASWQPGTPLESGARNFLSRFIQEFQNEWRGFALGKFKGELFLLFGESNPQIFQTTTSFWVFPWRVMLIVIILAVVAISGLIKLIKAYNRWVVRKAMEIRT